MKQVYSWNKDNNSITKDITFDNWLWSKKKNKYYTKIEDSRYMIIWFKNSYCMVFDKWEQKDSEPLRNYYHIFKDWLAYEIIPKFVMPF